MKKTPYQKHKDRELEKKKREEEEAAKLYEDFVESFDDSPEDKSFVRGETIQPLSNSVAPSDPNPVKKSGGRYVPSFLPPSMADSKKAEKPRNPMRRVEESVVPAARGGKTRNIDIMLEAMKR